MTSTIFLYCLLAWTLITLARMSGGGLSSDQLSRIGAGNLPEALFALTLAGCASTVWQAVLAHFDIVLNGWGLTGLFVGLTVWFYVWMQAGHGQALCWGDRSALSDEVYEKAKVRTQKLTPLVNFIAKLIRVPLKNSYDLPSIGFCRLFFVVKGFILLLPFGGLPGALLWSASYEVGYRLRKPAATGKWPFEAHSAAELLTGLAALIQVVIAWEGVKWLLA